jgi:predicted DNA-binding transcriptional regulator YafY
MQQHETEFVKRSFETALIKIKSSFHVYQKDDLLHLEDKLQISEPFRVAVYLPGIIDMLLRSILKKKIANISYLKSGASEMSVRSIEPVGIFHENNSWYVLAYCHSSKEYRHFRLDRIRNIDLSDTAFTLEHPAIDELRKIESQENITRIVIAIESRYAHFMYWDRQAYGFSREENKGEEVVMYFNCRQSERSFARWFMRFADVAKIVAPLTLRKEVKKILKGGMEKIK